MKYKCPDCGLVREYATFQRLSPTCCGHIMKRVSDDTPVSALDSDGGYS